MKVLLSLGGILLTIAQMATAGALFGDAIPAEGELNMGYGAIKNPDGDLDSQEHYLGGQLKVRPSDTSIFVLDGFLKNKKVSDFTADGDFFSHRDTEERLNQLYTSMRFEGGHKLTLGRQRLLWGHGFSFIPTDFINPPRDPGALDIENRKGVDSISLDIFGRRTSYTLLVNLDKSKDPGFGGKITNSGVAGLDLNAVYYYAKETGNAAGMSFSVDPLSWFSIGNGELTMIGSLAVKQKSSYFLPVSRTDMNGATYLVPGEPIGDDEGNIYSSLYGLYYELPQYRISMRAEYYRVGDAYSESQLHQLYSGLNNQYQFYKPWEDALPTGRTQQHYLSLSFGQDKITDATGIKISDTFGYSFSYLQGQDDKSELFSVALISTYFDSMEVAANWFIPVGESHSEFNDVNYDYIFNLSFKIVF
jgi:hypothetical protein